jgi:hypothetical protein
MVIVYKPESMTPFRAGQTLTDPEVRPDFSAAIDSIFEGL